MRPFFFTNSVFFEAIDKFSMRHYLCNYNTFTSLFFFYNIGKLDKQRTKQRGVTHYPLHRPPE